MRHLVVGMIFLAIVAVSLLEAIGIGIGEEFIIKKNEVKIEIDGHFDVPTKGTSKKFVLYKYYQNIPSQPFKKGLLRGTTRYTSVVMHPSGVYALSISFSYLAVGRSHKEVYLLPPGVKGKFDEFRKFRIEGNLEPLEPEEYYLSFLLDSNFDNGETEAIEAALLGNAPQRPPVARLVEYLSTILPTG